MLPIRCRISSHTFDTNTSANVSAHIFLVFRALSDGSRRYQSSCEVILDKHWYFILHVISVEVISWRWTIREIMKPLNQLTNRPWCFLKFMLTIQLTFYLSTVVTKRVSPGGWRSWWGKIFDFRRGHFEILDYLQVRFWHIPFKMPFLIFVCNE